LLTAAFSRLRQSARQKKTSDKTVVKYSMLRKAFTPARRGDTFADKQ
jgi:hypothetical protein